MGALRRLRMIVLAVVALLVVPAVGAHAARQTVKKCIWGPLSVNGVSQFPIYRELGVGVYHMRMRWASVATRRPAHPRNPRDRAYRWPAELTKALRQARRSRMRVAVEVAGSPAWANGGKPQNWRPRRPGDYANFMAAAAKRFRGVRYWIIWGEPVRQPNWMPLPVTKAFKPLTRRQARAPHAYARLLDAAYGAIKRVNRRALVVGGNSFTNGDIAPRNWISNLRLPNGRPPRMDLYGHNPFSARRPNLADDLIRLGMADFSDLDALAHWVDKWLGRRPNGRRIKLWLGEYFVPTDHANREFGWWVSRRTQASWLRSALRIVRRWRRVESLCWLGLYDDPPNAEHNETNRGLIDATGMRKPAFYVFKRG
jgi:hypothetical protein